MGNKFKEGDRVAAYNADPGAVAYWGNARMVGTVIRVYTNGVCKVELDNTGSQDSEGYNAICRYHYKQLRAIKGK